MIFPFFSLINYELQQDVQTWTMHFSVHVCYESLFTCHWLHAGRLDYKPLCGPIRYVCQCTTQTQSKQVWWIFPPGGIASLVKSNWYIIAVPTGGKEAVRALVWLHRVLHDLLFSLPANYNEFKVSSFDKKKSTRMATLYTNLLFNITFNMIHNIRQE